MSNKVEATFHGSEPAESGKTDSQVSDGAPSPRDAIAYLHRDLQLGLDPHRPASPRDELWQSIAAAWPDRAASALGVEVPAVRTNGGTAEVIQLAIDMTGEQERRDWADWIEHALGTVPPAGSPGLTIEGIVAALRAPQRPFGRAAGS